MHWIVELEEPHMRLNSQPETRTCEPVKILGAKSGLRLAVKGLEVCPFKAQHVEGKNLLISYPVRMLVQPLFQVRAEISQRARPRRAFSALDLAHAFKSPLANNAPQSTTIFHHPC